jgi:hypothetical protein
MQMKILTGIFTGLLLMAGLFFYLQQNSELPMKETQAIADRFETKVDSQSTDEHNGGKEPAKSLLTIANREQLLVQTKGELDLLMIEYDDNLKNPSKRKVMETEIAALLAEYNALLLPIALEKMKRPETPSS